jgi:hypothetical protein
MSISTARRRLRPEVTSPIDGSDHRFVLIFNPHFGSIVYRSRVICDFSAVKSGVLSFAAASGRLRPEVMSPFDSFDHGFLYVFTTHFLSSMHRYTSICDRRL